MSTPVIFARVTRRSSQEATGETYIRVEKIEPYLYRDGDMVCIIHMTDQQVTEYMMSLTEVSTLEWLWENGMRITTTHQIGQTTLCTYAAKGGHLEVLKWVRVHGCPWDEDTCVAAAQGGHLEVLKWLHEQGCPWDKYTCAYAARGGHLNVLTWLREHGCPWDEETCTNAAIGGHLDVLQWLRANGCPWDADTCSYASKHGHAELLRWAREHGCPLGEMIHTYGGNCKDIHQWIRRLPRT